MAKHGQGGGRLGRSATVTIRLDPQLRYLTEIAARSQRRTVSSFIEWALHTALREVSLDTVDGSRVALTTLSGQLWDVDADTRLEKLAGLCPALLSYDEQVRLTGRKHRRDA